MICPVSPSLRLFTLAYFQLKSARAQAVYEQLTGDVSLRELERRYGVPRSTIHSASRRMMRRMREARQAGIISEADLALLLGGGS